MSINAYRMRTDNQEFERPSFDFGHDEKLIELLNAEMQFYMSLNSFGTGIADVPIELLENAIGSPEDFELDDDTVTHLQSDIAMARSKKEDVVTYYCF